MSKPIEIVKVIRRMRGGSQAFLVQGSDGASYVAKFAGNPQGDRTLINECLASHLLSALGVVTPDIAILHLGDSCQGRELLYFQKLQNEPIASGLHFGSQCPVDPDQVAMFDFLPRALYSRVSNVDDLGVVCAFDQWVSHLDTRQFIFARNSRKLKGKVTTQRKGVLTAFAIDNGLCFGLEWNLNPKPQISSIFSHFDLQEAVDRGIELIRTLPGSEIESARRAVPVEWFAPGDEAALAKMLTKLQERQQDLVVPYRRSETGPGTGRLKTQAAQHIPIIGSAEDRCVCF